MNPRTTLESELAMSAPTSVDIPLLERLFDQSPDVAFFVKDAEGRYLAVNQSLVSRHGLTSKTEVIGKRPSDICEGDFGRIPAQQDAEVLKTGTTLINHLEMQWDQPHQPVWCFTTKLPIRDESGSVIGLIGISRDLRIPVGADEIPTKFAAALQRFEQDLSGNVTASGLAKICELTPQRLARLSKRIFGLTTTQLITKIRISVASRLLLESEQSVSEIAHQCGFYDHSAFTRAFRNATGLTPTDFRNL